MKTWKRLLSLALMLCLVLAVAPATAEDPIELHFVCAYAANYGMQDLIDDFEAAHPNVKIILDVYNNSSDGNQAVDNMLMAGDMIDLQLAYGLDKTDARASSDFYVNLDDYVADWGIDMQETFGVDIKMRNSEGEEHYFGIPVDALQWYIVINMTEWENAGLGELPKAWTWDEYIDACRKMTHDGIPGGADVLDGGYNWVNHVRPVYGADVWYNEEGYSAILSNPLFKEALQMKLDCETEGIWFPYPDARQTGNTQVAPFLEHRANSYVTCNVWRFIANTTDYPIDFKCGFAPYPTREPGQTNYVEGPTVYGFMTITNTCKHTDEAWEFVKYYYNMSFDGHEESFNGLARNMKNHYDCILKRASTKDPYWPDDVPWESLLVKFPGVEAMIGPFREQVDGCTAVLRQDRSIDRIVEDEAGRFFAGECSAEDCAARIQSRARLYLAEQS